MSRRTALLVLVIAALVTAARIALLNSFPDTGYFLKYVYYANQIVAGHVPLDRLADMSPLYLLFVTVGRALDFSRWAFRDIQLVMLTAAALLAGAAAFRVRGPIAGAAAAIIVLLNRAAVVNATEFEPETLLLLFISAGLLCLVYERPLLAGMFCGLGVITRPVPLLPVGAVVLLYLWRRRRTEAVRLATGTAIPVALVLVAHLILSGTATLMDPGMAFYEGMNPYATGYEGASPRIVKIIEPTIGGPDTMHEAYRIVASRAAGHQLSRRESNRYWTAKSIAFARLHPDRAALLVWRKFTYLVAAHDAWDVPSMTAVEHELRRFPIWLSFAAIIPLGAAGFVLFRRDDVALFAIGCALPLIIFTVHGRVRQAMLAPIAIGCGLAVAEIIARRKVVLAGALAVIAAVLSIDGPQQLQNEWIATALLRTGESAAHHDFATAATWMPDFNIAAPPSQLRAAALNAIAGDPNPSRHFASAISLQKAGDYGNANRVFTELANEHYDLPWENHAVSSVAYYLGKYDEARRDAPGDPDVLAACEALGDRGAGRELDTLWDPLTAAMSRRNNSSSNLAARQSASTR